MKMKIKMRLSHIQLLKKNNRLSAKKGYIMPSVILILTMILLLVQSIHQVKVSNTKQYQLLRDSYQLAILLEWSQLELAKELVGQDSYEEITFPNRLEFSHGLVKITFDKTNHNFLLSAHLKNGKSKTSNFHIDRHLVILKEKIVPEE